MRYNWTLRGRAIGERAHPTTGTSPGAWAGLAAALAASMVIAGYAAVDPAPRARLSTVSAKVGVRGASVLIEASEPVAYVTTRPDPLTVVVDLRNVTAAGVANRVSGPSAFPIAAVTTEDARGADGAPVARVRVLLAAPAQHQVRSDRNVIHVDVVPDDDSPGAIRFVGASPAPRTTAAAAARTLAPLPTTARVSDASPAEGRATPSVAAVPAAQTAAPAQRPPQAAASIVSQSPQQPGAGGRVYSGHPVSLDFQGADLRSVLRTFAEISGLNLVIDPDRPGDRRRRAA